MCIIGTFYINLGSLLTPLMFDVLASWPFLFISYGLLSASGKGKNPIMLPDNVTASRRPVGAENKGRSLALSGFSNRFAVFVVYEQLFFVLLSEPAITDQWCLWYASGADPWLSPAPFTWSFPIWTWEIHFWIREHRARDWGRKFQLFWLHFWSGEGSFSSAYMLSFLFLWKNPNMVLT